MNGQEMHPLTKEQSDFAAEQYGMVFRYLAHKRLDADEFHDVVILPFLRAVQQYMERPELQKYAFSTIAWRQMDSALSNYFARQKRRGALAAPRGLNVSPSRAVSHWRRRYLPPVMFAPRPRPVTIGTARKRSSAAGRATYSICAPGD